MVVYVFHNHFIGDVPGADGKVASRPEMIAPELPFQDSVLAEEFIGCFAFYELHYGGNREMGRVRNEYVDVIRGHFAFDDLDIVGLADLVDQIPGSYGGFSIEHLFAVFGNPNQVSFQIVFGMACGSIILHTMILRIAFRNIKLKSSPEGEGFSPIPRGRH